MRIVALIVVVLALAAIASANKQVCSQQYECGKSEYCSGGYCVSCVSDCDCGVNEYCSTNTIDLNRYGSCHKFDIMGDSCIGLGQSAIQDERVSNSSKCAITYYVAAANEGERQIIDKEGVCVGGKCRICNYGSQQTICDGSSSTQKGAPRQCVFPGKFSTVHSAAWAPGHYYEEPIRVWMAIFFCFIAIITLFNVVGFMFRK
eukprot:gene13225-15536_t